MKVTMKVRYPDQTELQSLYKGWIDKKKLGTEYQTFKGLLMICVAVIIFDLICSAVLVYNVDFGNPKPYELYVSTINILVIAITCITVGLLYGKNKGLLSSIDVLEKVYDAINANNYTLQEVLSTGYRYDENIRLLYAIYTEAIYKCVYTKNHFTFYYIHGGCSTHGTICTTRVDWCEDKNEVIVNSSFVHLTFKSDSREYKEWDANEMKIEVMEDN